MTHARERYREALYPLLLHIADGDRAGIGRRHRERLTRPWRARVYHLLHRRWPEPIRSQLMAARITDAHELMAHMARFKELQ